MSRVTPFTAHPDKWERPSTAPHAQEIQELYERVDRLVETISKLAVNQVQHADWVEGAIKDLYDRLVFKPSRWARFKAWLGEGGSDSPFSDCMYCDY